MKNIQSIRSVAIAACLFVPGLILAQAGVPSTPPTNAELRPVVPSSPSQLSSPTYELIAKWDSRSQVHTVLLANGSEKSLEVLGVQSTSGIFLEHFPQKVAAKKEEPISFVYHAANNTDGDLDVIRVLTDQGIKEIHVKIAREEVVRLDTRELRWVAGATAEAKTVTLITTAGTVAPTKVRVTGGHQAVLEKADATTWRVKVTPASTAKSGQFAVFVEFDKALPGRATVILGVIQPKE